MGARGMFVLFLVACAAAAGAFVWIRGEGEPPDVQGPDEIVVGGGGGVVSLVLHDPGSGLRQASVVLAHAQGEQILLEESWPGSVVAGAVRGTEPIELAVSIDSEELPKAVEEAFLRVSVRDWSLRDTLRGNETQLDLPITIDRKPPRIAVSTGLTYVRRGGSGVVVYSLSENAKRDGVEVGETFFPGFPYADRRIAFYAVPTDAPKKPELRVLAEDAAGNVGRARWPVVVNERPLPRADVRLPASFLEDKVGDLASSEGIEAADRKQAFQRINTELRDSNEARIRELLAEPTPERLWEGPFQQLPNSKVTSRFAERRRYFVGGEPVSEATHFGYDLASTAAAPVTAAANGRVVFADELGIYGNCVLVDHGLGVATLYGHLSRIDVAPGDRVEKGGRLGLTGATGLAGGDHLHFAVLVGGVYVDPLEWWDAKWMQSNVDARLASVGP